MRCESKLLRRVAASLVFGSFFVTATAVADHEPVIDPNNGYGPNDRPVFLFVSVAARFDLPAIGDVDADLRGAAGSLGSPVVPVNIGRYLAGRSIATTRFVGLSPVSIDLSALPPDPDTQLPPDFDEHQFTIVGSFKTRGVSPAIHMMTPYPGAIPPQVQEAFFTASPFLDDPGALPAFPTTVEMALFVFDHQGTAGATIDEIMEGMFGADPASALELVCESPCEAEGILFPHEEDAEAIFTFHSLFDPDEGIVSVEICLPVEIDVKPGSDPNSVNLGDNGVLPIAVLTTESFDAVEELDPSTLTAVLLDEHSMVVSSVAAVRSAEEDVDGDGDVDVTLKFDVSDLIAGTDAVLTESSTTLHFRGETYGGMCVEGSDAVRTVPPKK